MSKPGAQHPYLNSANAQNLSICGRAFVADPSGALFWPGARALVVADLQLSTPKSAAGQTLPANRVRPTLVALADTIDRYGAETVLVLGDSCAGRDAGSRLDEETLDALRIMQEGRDWIWIASGRERDKGAPAGQRVLPELHIAGITIRHEPLAGPISHEIAGSLQPAARLSFHGHVIRRPCFVGNARRLVLPAFATFTGGRNILDKPFERLFGFDGMSVWLMGQEGLSPVAARSLIED